MKQRRQRPEESDESLAIELLGQQDAKANCLCRRPTAQHEPDDPAGGSKRQEHGAGDRGEREIVDELSQQPLDIEPRQAFRPAQIPGAIGPLAGVLLLVRRSCERALKPIRRDQPPSSDERFLAGEDGRPAAIKLLH